MKNIEYIQRFWCCFEYSSKNYSFLKFVLNYWTIGNIHILVVLDALSLCEWRIEHTTGINGLNWHNKADGIFNEMAECALIRKSTELMLLHFFFFFSF